MTENDQKRPKWPKRRVQDCSTLSFSVFDLISKVTVLFTRHATHFDSFALLNSFVLWSPKRIAHCESATHLTAAWIIWERVGVKRQGKIKTRCRSFEQDCSSIKTRLSLLCNKWPPQSKRLRPLMLKDREFERLSENTHFLAKKIWNMIRPGFDCSFFTLKLTP